MDPSTNSGYYTQLPQMAKRDPSQPPEAYPNATATAGVDKKQKEPKPNPAMGLEDQHDEKNPDTPSLIELSYSPISTLRTADQLCYIIVANCLCSACIVLCLWGFSKIDDLTGREKRAFNALSLLLSAGLSFGVGLLFDRIGLLARGAALQSKPHSVKAVCSVV